MSAEVTSQVGFQIEAIAQQAEPKVVLTPGELDALVDEVISLHLISGQMKSAAAKVQRLQDGGVMISIPSRPTDAEDLWNTFKEQLATRISRPRAELVDKYLGSSLIKYFSGFGLADEVYTITPNATQSGKFDFNYSTETPRGYLEKPLSSLPYDMAGSAERSSGVALDNVVKWPQYAFLNGLLNRP